MKFISVLAFCISLFGCQLSKKKEPLQTQQMATIKWDSIATKSYEEIKQGIEEKRQQFSLKYSSLSTFNKKENLEEITSYWVTTISKDLYSKWENTPWDFNGTTTKPQQGNIACGFFVATIL